MPTKHDTPIPPASAGSKRQRTFRSPAGDRRVIVVRGPRPRIIAENENGKSITVPLDREMIAVLSRHLGEIRDGDG